MMQLVDKEVKDFLQDRVGFKFDIIFPNRFSVVNFESWAQFLIEKDSWFSSSINLNITNFLEEDERAFILAILQMSQIFLSLGRIPIFEDIQLLSLQLKDKEKRIFTLELSIIQIDFISPNFYFIPFKIAIMIAHKICGISPTLERLNNIYHTINQEVIQELRKRVHGGDSTIPLLKMAYQCNIPFIHLGLGVYQIGYGAFAKKLDRSSCQGDSMIGAKLSQNKFITANILKMAGLPAPDHRLVNCEQSALIAAEELGYLLVVKPSDCDRGEGVSLDIYDKNTLLKAFYKAQKLSPSKQVIVERQVKGSCYRLVIANNKLLYAVSREPMAVMGDGVRTVQELVDQQVSIQLWKAPWVRSEIQPIDDIAKEVLAKAGMSPEFIPSKGSYAPLRRIETMEFGGLGDEVTQLVHPENIMMALQAAKLFEIQIVGIDFITQDISRPWYENEAIINEINFAPLLGYFPISFSHLGEFYNDFIPSSGKIPIYQVENEVMARMTHERYITQGVKCFYTSADETIDYQNQIVRLFNMDIKRRLKALVLRSDVEAIVLHIKNL